MTNVIVSYVRNVFLFLTNMRRAYTALKETCARTCMCGLLGCKFTYMHSNAINVTSAALTSAVGTTELVPFAPSSVSGSGPGNVAVVVGCVVAAVVLLLIVVVSVYVCKRQRRVREGLTAQPRNQYGHLSLTPPVGYGDVADVRAPAALRASET